ncbi:hypothetical protein LCGC14_2792680 [marine sediment metagenome]|uniref:MIT domain-containing protein n=1 Tax=marine sediment metagenome TaxID=412755 RepID=A0A0F9AYQ7_9ZZZZ
MYKLKLHKNLESAKWQKFSMKQRELMIANELNRAKNWIEKNDLQEVNNCYERALELLDLTVEITKSGNRLREYLRLREMMGKLYIEKKGRPKLNNQVFNCICTMS